MTKKRLNDDRGNDRFYIGIDIGTGTVCGALFDADAGAAERTLSRDAGPVLIGAEPCFRSQDAACIEAAVSGIVRELSRGRVISGIGISCQMHGILYVDGSGNALSPLIGWQDGRGGLPFREGLSFAEYITKVSGERAYSGEGSVTLFHDTVKGLVPEGAARVASIGDYIAMRLCGAREPVVSPGIARSFGLYDMRKKRFKTDIIKSLGMDPALFPDVSEDVAVPVGRCVLLPERPPVCCAMGDNQASVLGAFYSCRESVSRRGRPAFLNLGTGSQISFISSMPGREPLSPSVEIRPFVKDSVLITGAPLCGGSAYAALESFFRETAVLFSGKAPKGSGVPDNIYPAMEKLLRQSLSLKPGEYPRARTWFSGSRTQKDVYGSFSGVTLSNFTPAGLIRSVAEGVIADLMDCFNEITAEFSLEKPAFIITTGGALRQNATLTEMVSERFGLPAEAAECKEEAALGAAVSAAGKYMADTGTAGCGV